MKKPRTAGKAATETRPAPAARPATTAAILGEAKAAAPKIPAKWASYYRALQNLREGVLRGQLEHTRTAAEPLEPHSLSEADSATDEIDHDLALSRLSAGQDSLNEIEQALKR
ncbi:MAG TPA: transcriptional regulator, partial [Verrucomicrobiae bacterium]|nr:transcriptional regulator [Verrucomicrobiae bacterium]